MYLHIWWMRMFHFCVGWVSSRSGWLLELLTELKMAIILPIGQWYAPSAVIYDAWYCMVLHGIALYCIVLQGVAWYCMVLNVIAWFCMVLHDIAWYCMVWHCLHGIALYCM